MICMEMCQDNIRNIFGAVASFSQSFNQPFSVMQEEMPEEFLILLVSPAGVNKYDMTFRFDNKGSQCENDKVIFIGRINSRP